LASDFVVLVLSETVLVIVLALKAIWLTNNDRHRRSSNSHRALLGLRRLYAGGAKTDSYRGRIACLFFSAAREQKRRKGSGGSHEFMLCSCKLRLRRGKPEWR
jgi:hypothetical protein